MDLDTESPAYPTFTGSWKRHWFLDKITRSLEEGASAEVIYLDFAKHLIKYHTPVFSTNYEATASAEISPTGSKSG